MSGASLVAQRVERLPAMWEPWVQSLGQEDALEKEMATHPGTLAWKIHGVAKSRTRLSDFTFTFSFTLLCSILQWLPRTWKIKSSLYMMLYTACVIWPLISYRLLNPHDFRHSGLYESSHNTRNGQASASAALCLNTFSEICAELASSLLSGVCSGVASCTEASGLPLTILPALLCSAPSACPGCLPGASPSLTS